MRRSLWVIAFYGVAVVGALVVTVSPAAVQVWRAVVGPPVNVPAVATFGILGVSVVYLAFMCYLVFRKGWGVWSVPEEKDGPEDAAG